LILTANAAIATRGKKRRTIHIMPFAAKIMVVKSLRYPWRCLCFGFSQI